MLRTIYGFDDLGRKVPTGSYDDGAKAVGGRIFYIDSNSDETVEFYDAQGNVISNVVVGDTPTYYKVTSAGVSGKDKYYVVDDTTGWVDNKTWGYYNITTGATGRQLGSGKTNTSTILAIDDTSQYSANSIFTYLRNTQNAGDGVNGCKDWFIGSFDELDPLRTSAILDWTGKYTWSSVEDSATFAFYQPSNSWFSNDKSISHSIVFIRSF